MTAYYNEIDPYAAQWLRNLIAENLIAPGDVDERSIADVQPSDLAGYVQCHFFAGIGGWSYAARLAGWPDDRPLWTGSCPCQPFSVAGKQEGQSDERHLWPVFFDLIRACRPDVVMGEQVAAAVGKHWLDGVHSDLEGIGYACGASVVPACAVDAPHRRDRLWFVADTGGIRGPARFSGSLTRQEGVAGEPDDDSRKGTLANADGIRRRAWSCGDVVGQSGLLAQSSPRQGQDARWVSRQGSSGATDALAYADEPIEREGRQQRSGQFSRLGSNSRGSHWIGSDWLPGADERARRIEPGIRLLAHGISARVGKLRAYGNAIVPQVAAEVIGAYLEARAA